TSMSDPSGLRVSEPSADANFHEPTYWIQREVEKQANAAEQGRITNAYKAARGAAQDVVPTIVLPVCTLEGPCERKVDFSGLAEMAHLFLGIIGLVPVVGEIADGLDALVCLAEEDLICAGLSVAAMIPFVGWGAAAAKGAKLTGEAIDGAAAAGKAAATSPRAFSNLAPHDVVRPFGFQAINPASLRATTGTYNYVVDASGQLILGNRRYGHIDLANGGDVQAAGEFKLLRGEVQWINNASGHYKPTGPGAQAAAEAAFGDSGLLLRPGAYSEIAP
ncbi:hypothetical protein, partial [Agromyces mediolanus]|uniref:hypothetical protein n=1 Tax=Agromyces mediolanus TaxID=41986 RepID=UPI001E432ECE